MAKATFGAGCFWGVESAFRKVAGVIDAAVGYAGGHTQDPTYKEVCSGRTDHAEVVQVDYDPERVTYDELLETFWSIHNPTTRNRQGFDIGSQYRSAIFFHSPEQQEAAAASKERAQTRVKREIVTEITPAPEFWRAEEYHQRYFEKTGREECAI